MNKTVPDDYGQIRYIPVSIEDIRRWKEEWLEENDSQDGTGCVTPFDKYLY